jgi:hypothetical protein
MKFAFAVHMLTSNAATCVKANASMWNSFRFGIPVFSFVLNNDFFSSKQQCIGTEYYQVVNRIIPIYCNNGHSRWKVFKAGLLANLLAPIHDASRNSVTGVLIRITTLQSHRMTPLLQQWLSITSILRGCLLTVFHHFFISFWKI